MICPKCDSMMESCGYGDNKCPECGHMEYAESQEDFDARMGLHKNMDGYYCGICGIKNPEPRCEICGQDLERKS